MRGLHCTPFAIALCVALGGCDIYKDHFKGDFNAGSADPNNYPPPYRGVGYTRNIAGSGSGITQVLAYINGAQTGYFLFPYGTTQVATPRYPPPAGGATIAGQTQNALTINRLPTVNIRLPLAYVFDPQADANPPNPFPDAQQCQPPPGYQYDQRRDDVRYDEQGNIFTLLPSATFAAGSLPTWSYVPIVQHVPVASNGEPCQEIKSERTLLNRGDVTVAKNDSGSAGVPDGRYLAWALIDPGTAVYAVGQRAATSNGLGIQRWGWYQQFLVAYLDGGYIPVDAATGQFKTQRLFIPRGQVSVTVGTTTTTQPARVADPRRSYDVLEFPRGHPEYSPICRVQTYNTGATAVDETTLPRSAAVILTTPRFSPIQNPPAAQPNLAVPDTYVQPFVFCLQVSVP